jgi:hypothetical protein
VKLQGARQDQKRAGNWEGEPKTWGRPLEASSSDDAVLIRRPTTIGWLARDTNDAEPVKMRHDKRYYADRVRPWEAKLRGP